MVIYGLTLVPLSKHLREKVPEVVQPFYADDLSLSDYATYIAELMTLLLKHGHQEATFQNPQNPLLSAAKLMSTPPEMLLETLTSFSREGADALVVLLEPVRSFRSG